MKKLLVVGIIGFCFARVQAQNVEGQIIASEFGQYQVTGTMTGSFQFTPASCQVSGGGKNFAAFTSGVAIKIVDSNPALTEIQTPVAVFIGACAVSMSTTYVHAAPFYLTSGTGGLQEALLNGPVRGGGPNTVILNADWYAQIQPRSAAAVIASVVGNTNLGLVDVTTTPYTAYAWNGSHYASAGTGGAVSSVFGRTGTVSAVSGDYSVAQITGAAPLSSPAFTGTPSVPTAANGTNTTQAASTAFVQLAVAGSTLSVLSYGAHCNWNGTSGTDDTAAFNSAATAAHALYVTSGAPVVVAVPYGCTLGTSAGNTTVTWPSGVYWEGPGEIIVPAQTTNALFQATSSDDIAFEHITVNYLSNLTECGPTINNDLCIALRYDSANPGTGATHHHVFIRDNELLNSGWGVLIGPQAGTDRLDGVIVSGNFIGQTNQAPITSYQFNDGIHIGGAVSSFVIANNVVTGRSDAGIAVSSEFSTVNRVCHDGSITGNTLYEDRVGIDNSGCSHLTISGNQVYADIPVGNSNPAFRSIFYAGQLPTNVDVNGNTFHNDETLSGSDVSAKFDCFGGCGNGSGTVNLMSSSFTGNKLQTFYADGSEINVSDNLFEDNVGFPTSNQNSITINWDTVNVNGSYYVTIGPNNWQYRGQISLANRSDIYFADVLYPQNTTNGQLTISNPQSFGVPQLSAFYNYLVPSGGFYGYGTTTPGVGTAVAGSCLVSGVIQFETAANCGTSPANANAPIAAGDVYDLALNTVGVVTNTSGGHLGTSGVTGSGLVVEAVSPGLTGTPTAPTAAAGTNTTQIATTANVEASIPASTVAFTHAQTAPAFFPQTVSAGPYVNYFDDFLTSANMTNQAFNGGTGSCATSTTFLDNTSPGTYSAISGTAGSGTGFVCVTAGAIYGMFNAATAPAWTWETRVIVPVLPGTTAGSYQAGLVHTQLASPWTTGIGFYLSSANGVVNDWYCRYGSTQTDSTVAAVASAWTRLSVASDGSNVHWYVNGTQVCGTGTAVASMPTTALLAAWSSVAGSGTSVSMGLDYVGFQMAVVR